MKNSITFTIDGVEVKALAGQTIMEAADAAKIYIPRLCAHKDLVPHGSCCICIIKINRRTQSACTEPAAEGIIVENETEEIIEIRKDLVDMLFVEGNHYCMFCERSGNCELQALAYRFGILAPKYSYMFPVRKVDASHPDILIDRDRCVLCGRCVIASRDIDGKNVFQFVERGLKKRIAVNAEANLSETDITVTDKAVEICPVGALMKKRVGYTVPYGERFYDQKPIGSDIETAK